MDTKSHLFILKVAFLCLFMAATSLAPAQTVDGIAAIVNDKVITFSDVKREVELVEGQLRTLYSGLELMEKIKETRLTALKALIERDLIIQDFDEKGFEIPKNIVENRLHEVINEKYGGDRRALIRTLQANGVPLSRFKEELREQLIVQAMRSQHVGKVVIVSPFQIEQHYQENIDQYTRPQQVKLRLIFLRKSLFKEKRVNEDGREEEVDPQKNIIEEIYRKIEIGSDFAELARSYSEGAQRSNGGDWGWVSKDSLRKELAAVAFDLKPGQFSEIITTDDGYYIMLVEDVRRESVIPLDDIRDDIEKELQQEERKRLEREWIDQLRTRAFIKMF